MKYLKRFCNIRFLCLLAALAAAVIGMFPASKDSGLLPRTVGVVPLADTLSLSEPSRRSLAPRSDFGNEEEGDAAARITVREELRRREEPSVAFAAELLYHARAFYRLMKGAAAQKTAADNTQIGFLIHHLLHGTAAQGAGPLLTTDLDQGIVRAALETMPADKIPAKPLRVELISFPADKRVRAFAEIMAGMQRTSGTIPCLAFLDNDGSWVLLFEKGAFQAAGQESRMRSIRKEAEKCALNDHGLAGIYEYLRPDRENALTPETVLRSIHEKGLAVKCPQGIVLDPPASLVAGNVLDPVASVWESGGKIYMKILETGRTVVRRRAELEAKGIIRPDDKTEVFMPVKEPDTEKLRHFLSVRNSGRPKNFEKFSYTDGALVVRDRITEDEKTALLAVFSSEDDRHAVEQLCEASRTSLVGSKLLRHEIFYGGRDSLLGTVYKRPWDAPGMNESDLAAERFAHSVVFIAEIRDLAKGDAADERGVDGIVFPVRAVPPASFVRILVPEGLEAAARRVFADYADRIRPVRKKPAVIELRGEMTAMEVPDYEGAAEAVARERPGAKLWAHAARLPAPSDISGASRSLSRVFVLTSADRYEEALAQLDRHLRRYGPYDEEAIIRAYCCQMLGRRQEAARLYAEFLTLGRDSRHFGLSAEHIREALVDCRGDVVPIKAAMRELFNAKQWQGTIDMADQVLKRKENDRDALFSKGVALIEQRRFEEAASCFRQFNESRSWCSHFAVDVEEAANIQTYCEISAEKEKVLAAYDRKDWSGVIAQAQSSREKHPGTNHPDIAAAHAVALQEKGNYIAAVNAYSRLLFLFARGAKCSLPGIDRSAAEVRRAKCARLANDKIAAEKKAYDEFHEMVYAKAYALYRLKMGKEQAKEADRKAVIEHLFRHLSSAPAAGGASSVALVEQISGEEMTNVAGEMPPDARPEQPVRALLVSIPPDRHGVSVRARVRQEKDAARWMIIRNSDGSGWTVAIDRAGYDAAGAYEKREGLREALEGISSRELSEKIVVSLEEAFEGIDISAKDAGEYARMIAFAIAAQNKNTMRLLVNGGFLSDADLKNIRQRDMAGLVKNGLARKVRQAVDHFRERGFPISFAVRNISIYGIPVKGLDDIRKRYALGSDTAVLEAAFRKGGFLEQNVRDLLQAVTRYAPQGAPLSADRVQDELELLREGLRFLMTRSTDTVCAIAGIVQRPTQVSRSWALQLQKGSSVPQKGQYLVRVPGERGTAGKRSLFRVDDVNKASRTVTVTEVDWRGSPSAERTSLKSGTTLLFGLREADAMRMQRQLAVIDTLLESAAARRYLSTGVKIYDRLLGLLTLTHDTLADVSITNANLDLTARIAVKLALNNTEMLVIEGDPAEVLDEIMLQMVAGADKDVLLITPDNADAVAGADMTAAVKKHDVVIVTDQSRDVALIAPLLVKDNGKLVYMRRKGSYPLFGISDEESRFMRSAGAAALQKKIAAAAAAIAQRGDRVVLAGGVEAGGASLEEFADELSQQGGVEAVSVPWSAVPQSAAHFSAGVTMHEDIVDEMDRTVLPLPIRQAGGAEHVVRIVCDRTIAASAGPVEQLPAACKAALNMCGAGAERLPAAVFIGPLDASPSLVTLVPEKYFVGINAALRNVANDGVRIAIARTGLFHAFSRILTPYPPASFKRDQLMRDAAFFSDQIDELRRAGKVPVAPAAGWLDAQLAGVAVTDTQDFKEFLAAVAAEEAARAGTAGAPAATEGPSAARTSLAGTDDMAGSALRRHIDGNRSIGDDTKRFVERIVFSPQNPAANWSVNGVMTLCELLTGDYLHPFDTAFEEKKNWIVPVSFRELLEEVKDIPNIGGIFADMPLRELLRPAPGQNIEEIKFKMQGSMTELYVAYVLRKTGKTITRVNTPLPRPNAANEKDNFTEIDISLSDPDGIVEVKSRITKQAGTFEQTADEKIRHLNEARRAGHLKGVANKLCYVMSAKTIYRKEKELQEKLRNAGYPRVIINVAMHPSSDGRNTIYFSRGAGDPLRDFDWDDDTDLAAKVGEMLGWAGIDPAAELKFIIYAPEVVRRLTAKYNNAAGPDAWHVDIVPIPNIVFMRPPEEIRAAVDARKGREKAYLAALGGYFGVAPENAGNVADTAGTALAEMKAAVTAYGTKAVTAKNREEIEKWISLRKFDHAAGYLRVVDEIREALQPYDLNLVWSEIGDSGPASNPQRRLTAYLEGIGIPLYDVIEIVRSFRKILDDVLEDTKHLGYTARNVRFIIDPAGDPFVKHDRMLIFNLAGCIVPSANPFVAGIVSRAVFSAVLSSTLDEDRETAAARIKLCADELAALREGPFAYLRGEGIAGDAEENELAAAAAAISGMGVISPKRPAAAAAAPAAESLPSQKTEDEQKWDKIVSWIQSGDRSPRKVSSVGQINIPGQALRLSVGTQFGGKQVTAVLKSAAVIDWYEYDPAAADRLGRLLVTKQLVNGVIETLLPVREVGVPSLEREMRAAATVDTAA